MKRLSIHFLILTLLTLGFAETQQTTLHAQIFGVPTATKELDAFDLIAKLAPEDEPMACWIWNRGGEPNANGNAGEQWFADDDLQNSLAKLKRAIGKLADNQESELLKQFSQEMGWLLASKAGIAVYEDMNVEEETLNATIAIRLDEDAERVSDFLDKAMAEFEIASESIDGSTVYSIPQAPFDLVVGIQQDHLVYAAGQGQWESIRKRISGSKGMPGWLKSRLKSLPIDRRSHFAFASVSSIIEVLPPELTEAEAYQRISKALDLNGFKSIAISSGADETSNLSLVHVECEKAGLGGIMNVPPIEESKIRAIPAESVSAVAMRFSPENILEIIDQSVPKEELEKFWGSFTEASGLDLRSDILDHMEGTMLSYQTGSLINPKQVAVVRIRDEAKFAVSYEKINSTLAQLAAETGFEFTEQTKRGQQVFGMSNFGVAAFWSFQNSNLYLASNARAIGSHIRKASKGGVESVLETQLGAKVLAESKTLGLEGPILAQHFDLDQIIEFVMPLAQGFMNFIPPEAADMFDFGAGDFPPIESLVGLRPSSSMLFKNDSGYFGISRYDTPLPLELTTVAAGGVAVGVMLPAVQQVREAARRTQSMNNLRQLALACLNYEAANRSFPPAYTVDEDGKPLLSWRVAILPYLEQQDLYDQFRQDEPWDSEHNRKLLAKMPDVFRNPSVASETDTAYAAPVIDGSVLAADANRFADITDGSSNTILIVEVGESQQLPWTAPRDLDVSSLTDLDFDNGHPGTILFTLCDGSTHAISKMAGLDEFLEACKKADGSSIDALLDW